MGITRFHGLAPEAITIRPAGSGPSQTLPRGLFENGDRFGGGLQVAQPADELAVQIGGDLGVPGQDAGLALGVGLAPKLNKSYDIFF